MCMVLISLDWCRKLRPSPNGITCRNGKKNIETSRCRSQSLVRLNDNEEAFILRKASYDFYFNLYSMNNDMVSGEPIDDLIESGTLRLLDWKDSMTDIQLGMRFIDKVQVISAVQKWSIWMGREYRVVKSKSDQ
ncbi:hypothetical protein M9H77_00520 [Catharanthus roseus]|nr:hypothetical protein M9H77_00520 [Catharanthus roseus]